MISMKGTIKDNPVVIHDEAMSQRDMGWYEGRDVIVTILDRPSRRPKEDIDLSQYVPPTERGRNADQYIRELRAVLSRTSAETEASHPKLLSFVI